MNEIWKLQRALASNETAPPVLAYTEGHGHESFIQLSDEQINELFGDAVKIYVEGEVSGPAHNGILTVERRVPDQDW